MEYQIGTTDLRQRLTDVLQSIREEGTAYVIETFGRPQAALISMGEYRHFRRYQEERENFFTWLEETAEANALRNADLSETDLLSLIEQARQNATVGG